MPGAIIAALQRRTVALGDRPLTGIDADGVRWTVNKLTGWLDGPPVRSAGTDRPADHGQWLPAGLYGARTITVDGSIEAPTRDLMLAARDDLAAACSDLDALATFLVVDGATARQASARRGGELLTKPKGPTGLAYSLPLTAPDPRIYGPQQSLPIGMLHVTGGFAFPYGIPLGFGSTTGGTVTAVNDGSTDAPVLIRLDGPLTTPWVENSTQGRRLALNLVIAAGDFVLIDSDAPAVLAGGTASRMSAKTGAFPTLSRGANVIRFGASAGTGTATVTFRPPYV